MLSETSLKDLRAGFRGELITPADPAYDEARRVHNGMIDRRPALIARCLNADDVSAVISFARQHSQPLAVRGGGHNVAGFAVCDDGVVIDLGLLNKVQVDAERSTVRVGGGATWADVNNVLQNYGLAAAGGFVGTTGVGGLTLGGGLGWLARKHGTALDNLLRAQVVLADGTIVTASSSENSDLFWALRGGGGNFGVVTEFEYQAHPAGTVWAGLAFHPLDRAVEGLRFFREYEQTSPQELTNGALILSIPPELPLPEALKQGPLLGIGGVYTGALDAGEAVVRPMREWGPPVAENFRTMSYSDAQTMADFLWPRGLHNYWKSNYLKDLSDGAIETIVAFARTMPSPRTVIVLEHNGGCGFMTRAHDDDTAFAHRDCEFNLLITAQWTDPAEADANIRWTREFWQAMQPFGADAVYLNYLGSDELRDRLRQAYGHKYDRLVALKQKYDPENVFRLNQNIRPEPAAMERTA